MLYYDKTNIKDLERWLILKYPLTIVADRYKGTYSGAQFIAWPCHSKDIPSNSQGSDCNCADFWWGNDNIICGKGKTVEESYRDLVYKIKQVINQRWQKRELEHERITLGSVKDRVDREEKEATKFKKYYLRCCTCGRFISFNSAKCEFTPDSDYSVEEYNWFCKKCYE